MFFFVLNIFSRVLGNTGGGIIANIIGAGQFDPPPLPPCNAIMTKARVQ